MKNDIRIIFVDIDWTLLNHKWRPGKYDMASIQALKRVQKKGVKVFICTARPYHSVKHIGFFDLFKPDGMILANGGLVIDGDKIIYQPNMNRREFERLCELALSFEVPLEFIRPYDSYLISPATKEVDYLYQTYPEEIPPVMDYHNQDVIGCTLFAPKELDEKIRPNFPKEFYYFRYHDYGVDIASIPHIKGDAIKVTLEELGISKENAMAIGDDEADISMFEQVKIGVAMGNAKDKVKESANIITKDIDHHGVRYILRKLI